MRIGIVGYQGTGKSTVFQLLTGVKPDPAKHHTGQIGIAFVPDERFDRLVSPEKNLVPELGIFAVEIGKDVAEMLPPLRKSGGLVVAGRAGNAPLSEMALAPGDVIFEVDGESVNDLAGLRAALAKVGEVGLLQIQRGSVLSFIAFEPNAR